MTKAESKKLPLGLYRVWWKRGGFSFAALGMLPNGDRWLAPTNWVHSTEIQNVWRSVDRLDPIMLNACREVIA